VVNVVYVEEDAQFDPSVIKSHFTHVFLIVQRVRREHSNESGWRVITVSNRDVPLFGPFLPNNGLFINSEDLRKFVLSKGTIDEHCKNSYLLMRLRIVINAELAAYKAPAFRKLHDRTRQAIFDSLLQKAKVPDPRKSTDRLTKSHRSLDTLKDKSKKLASSFARLFSSRSHDRVSNITNSVETLHEPCL
jgi:hypothetical protein